MSFVENILAPIFQLLVYICLIGWGFFIIRWIFKKAFPNFRWFFKYKILRSNYKEEDVQWCIDAINKKIGSVEIKKFLLINGFSVLKTQEILYVFKEVEKKVKGGMEKNGRQLEQSDGEIEKIPQITKERRS